MGTILSDLLKPMLRRAGITQLPGITPSSDQYGELIPEVNRMLASFNLDGHKIFTTSIDRYTLVPNQQIYFIGPVFTFAATLTNTSATAAVADTTGLVIGQAVSGTGIQAGTKITGISVNIGVTLSLAATAGGLQTITVTPDFIAPRPTFIYRANLVITGQDPELHLPLTVLTDSQWAAHMLTHLEASWPWEIYNDGEYPQSTLYLYGYPNEVNDLELFTWQQLKSSFTASTDAAIFPPGYEDMIVTRGALRARRLYPYDSKLSVAQVTELERDAVAATQAVQILNTDCPPMSNEAALLNRGNRSGDLKSEFCKWGGNLP
jgi:hypothetical protein